MVWIGTTTPLLRPRNGRSRGCAPSIGRWCLAGGRDKGLDWGPFAQEAVTRVRVLVAFGECRVTVAKAVQEAAAGREGPEIHLLPDLEEAVALAGQAAREGEVVLLSPGGTSFDAFVDFEARGDRFRELVKEL